MKRDQQRQRAYNAERNAFSKTGGLFPPHDQKRDFRHLEPYCRPILNKALACCDAAGIDYPARIDLLPGARARNAFQRLNTITLPQWARNEWVILHELAHVIIWYNSYKNKYFERQFAGHGPEWASMYLWLVREMLGKDAADRLLASFAKERVTLDATVPACYAEQQPAAPKQQPKIVAPIGGQLNLFN